MLPLIDWDLETHIAVHKLPIRFDIAHERHPPYMMLLVATSHARARLECGLCNRLLTFPHIDNQHH
jgi:hypothetical protein